MTAWLAFVFGGLLTFGMRASFLLFGGDRALPAPVERSLRYVGPAVFAAIVAPAVFRPGDTGSLTVAPVLALLVGGAVMWRTRNMLLLLGSGMAVLWILQAVGL